MGMNTDKHTRVCATCGQGFTRNSSAVRHNYNLHSGQAMIVRPYDYIIGRLRGEFSPSDPAMYKSYRKNRANSSVFNYPFQTKNNERTNSEVYADTRTLESHTPNFMYTPYSHERVLNPTSRIANRPISQKLPYDSSRLLEQKLKLEELRFILFKNYAPLVAGELLANITYLAKIKNDNNFLDFSLNFQRMKFGNA